MEREKQSAPGKNAYSATTTPPLSQALLAANVREGPAFQPLRVSLSLMCGYIILCVSYIWISDHIATHFATDVQQLQQIESIKGTIFILVSALGLFFLSWGLLSLIARQEVELLQRRNALIENERRATAGLFASSVAHDINNILTAFQIDINELEEADEISTEHRQVIQQLNTATEDLSVLAKRLVALGKRGIQVEFVDLDLIKLIRETVGFIKTHTRVKNCRIEIDVSDSIVMRASPTILRQMLVNLILNAADATNQKGIVRVRASQMEREIVLEVHDNGPGIPPEHRKTIFTEMTTTKPNGFGLGLLSTKVYTGIHQGRLEVTDSPLGGACFRVILPVHEPVHFDMDMMADIC